MSRIVAAWAESASGPGWANAPVWVLVRERDGTLRLDCLQPSEQTHAMHLLYRVSACATAEMTAAVRAHLEAPTRRRKKVSA